MNRFNLRRHTSYILFRFFLVASGLSVVSNPVEIYAAEPNSNDLEQATQQNEEKKNTAGAGIEQSAFPYDLSLIRKASRYDAIEEFTVSSIKHLLLTYSAKGVKLRGDLIFLPDTALSPISRRIVYPLSQQLVRLGWNVHAVTISEPNSPIWSSQVQAEETIKNNESDASLTQNAAPTESEAPSASQQALNGDSAPKSKGYQDYFNELLRKIIGSNRLQGKPVLVIAHGDTAYWALDSLSELSNVVYTVLLMPRLPTTASEEELMLRYSKQQTPIYLFIPQADESHPFLKGLSRKKWPATNIRISSGLFTADNLPLVDSRIARMITGWVESSKK